MSAEFVHLHFHTHYSLLDGAIKIKGLDQILKEKGYQACAITDHGNLHGVIEFHHTLKKAGLKPIIGMEAYIAKGHRTNRTYSRPGPNAYHAVLLCENKQGYQNLIKLASQGFTEGKYYGKPRIDHELLERHNQGLIVLSACLQGEIANRLLKGEQEEAEKTAKWYQEVFDGRYFIELQANGIEDQNRVNPLLIGLAQKLGLPLIGTNDCHYPTAETAEPQYILQLMGWQKRVTDTDVKQLDTKELYIKSPEEMKAAFQGLPDECLKNSLLIADRCEIDLFNKKHYLPDYPVRESFTLEEELVDQAAEGLKERLEKLKVLYGWSENEEVNQRVYYKERLEFELKVINQMGFPGYFLIVADFINWSKNEGIPVGPGRGSGAGSLVAYSLKITDIDPIRFDLLFERFLNPARVSMPDFDIDFEVEGRDRVIDYVRRKYGAEKVCQISAIGSLQAKGALRGVARVLDFPYADADKIAKLIPNELNITLEDSFKKEPKLAELKDNGNENETKLIQVALALEGLNNNLSTHAAGVIIMNSPITEVMPICTPTKGDLPQSMFTMKYAEDQGAVKFDFLGLRNLSVIDRAISLINRSRKPEEQIDISLIALDDPKTYQLLCRGETTGVFQLESSGMKNLILKLKPDCFEDIIALVALFRPGPLGSGMVDDFVERKHGRQSIRYPHPLMEGVLDETYGVMVYQEQVMRAVQVLAGFSLGDADLLRRAIGKKIPEVLAEQRESFVKGCAANDIGPDKANEIFDLIDKFAGYGFNKSHSAAYAMISYQTAWLKANYPVEFMAALMTTERTKPDSVVKLINECKQMKIPVLPPDINESDLIFTAAEGRIRFGLEAIKNVGESALKNILEARKNCGGFKTLVDVFTQIDSSKVNVRVLEALVKGGVFDSLDSNRRQTFENLTKLVQVAQAEKNLKKENHVSLFDFLSEDEVEQSRDSFQMEEFSEWKFKQRLKLEKEALGFFISGHPLAPYADEIKTAYPIVPTSQIKTESNRFKPKDPVCLAGVVVTLQIKLTRENKERAILLVEDLWGTLEVLIFPRQYEKIKDKVDWEDPILITGNVRYESESTSFIAQKITPLKEIREKETKELRIHLPQEQATEYAERIKNIFEQHPGNCDTSLAIVLSNGCRVVLALKEKIAPTENLIEELEEFVKNARLEFMYKKEDPAEFEAIA